MSVVVAGSERLDVSREAFDLYLTRADAKLLPHQLAFAHFVIDHAPNEGHVRQFFMAGHGSGKTFAFEVVERYLAGALRVPESN